MSSQGASSGIASNDCGSCDSLEGRRAFIRSLAASATGALLTLGASPALARALELSVDARPERRGDEASYPLPAADGTTIDTANEVILVRFHNVIYAFALSCPHQNTALKWVEADHRFQCPKHKSLYQPDGVFIEGRATRGMDRYAIRRDGAKVIVDLSRVFEQDKDGAGWSAAQLPVA